jgi:AcrR family transcriptional regulator
MTVTMINQQSARSRILTVADELFYRRGLHAVGVDEIVAQSGVAKTTLYAHFKSKDQLIASYLQRRSDDWRVFLERELGASSASPAEKIDLVFGFLAEGCADSNFRGCPFINFLAEYPDPDHPGRAVCLAHRRWLRAFLAGIATEGGASDPFGLGDELCYLYDAAMIGSQFDGDGAAARRVRQITRATVQRTFAGADVPR